MNTLSKVRSKAHDAVTKGLKYRMKAAEIDVVFSHALQGKDGGFPPVSREAIVLKHLRENVISEVEADDLKRIRKEHAQQEVLKGLDPYDPRALRHFLPAAINALERVEGIGTKIKPKLEVFEGHKDNPILQDCFVLAYDWHLAYGVGSKFTIDWSTSGSKANTLKAWTKFVAHLRALNEKPAANQRDLDRLTTLLEKMTVKYRKWAFRILQRDLKIGFKEGNVRKVWKDLLPSFNVSLCSTVKRDINLERVLSELPPRLIIETKYDGLRTLVQVTDSTQGLGRVYSRKGLPLDHLQYLVREAAALLNAGGYTMGVLDCEAVAKGSTKYSDAVSAQTTQDMEDRPLQLMVFDFIWDLQCFEDGVADVAFGDRRSVIEELLDGSSDIAPSLVLSPARRVGSKDRFKKIMHLYGVARNKGYEGIVIKDVDASYAAGERNRKRSGYHRIKPFETVDVEVVGFYPGNPGTKYEHILGGLKCRLDNGVEIQVGGGYSDAQREKFWEIRDSLLGTTIEIERQEDTPGIKTRHASFVRRRLKSDK